VSDSVNQQKRELECLRLASDLRQLSRETRNPDFKAHCVRMADVCLISYRRGKMLVLDRAGLEDASCECYAVVKQRFDDFLKPPATAVQTDNQGRSKSRPGRTA
jgi:hypothetical protein